MQDQEKRTNNKRWLKYIITIIAVNTILAIAIALLVDHSYEDDNKDKPSAFVFGELINTIGVWIVGLLIKSIRDDTIRDEKAGYVHGLNLNRVYGKGIDAQNVLRYKPTPNPPPPKKRRRS